MQDERIIKRYNENDRLFLTVEFLQALRADVIKAHPNKANSNISVSRVRKEWPSRCGKTPAPQTLYEFKSLARDAYTYRLINGLCILSSKQPFQKKAEQFAEQFKGKLSNPLDSVFRDPRSETGSKKVRHTRGIVSIHQKPDIQRIVTQVLTTATQEVWFFGVSLDLALINIEDEFYKEFLSQGIKIKFLIFDPSSDALNFLADDLNIDPTVVEPRCTTSVATLRVLLKEQQDTAHKNALEVRLTPRIPRIAAYISDPDAIDSKSFFIFSMNNRASGHLPAFEIVNSKDGLFRKYFELIQKEWNRCSGNVLSPE